ncbi:mycothiol synthase [Corynebacterium silvaticum]|uniref:Mycothiol acetyltransferase n=1 Tax=Corynebacterium silvaticum TaxID=2320431 RepID=A0A7Y4UPP8_9CORY|nr:mycothiol synthase [Corynebacterium silvaticum]ARU46688.1 mycothiol synthase [Corynebacterium silvaticum]MBH5301180.1 mycothiol synthase [Corynebacterium silvaticum]NOM65804.1 mycothiol synthase [Corynebacterium silvaticum]NON71078.1 mycothiol synthase [Corynebacterium silvaticum]TFA91499.1 mycothiol synthase [Corynebacterium silvaticum]
MIFTSTQIPADKQLSQAAVALVKSAQAVDGVAPLAEHLVAGLENPELDHHHIVVHDNSGQLSGVGAYHGGKAEFVVAPEHRNKGIGRALARKLLDTGLTDFWSHGYLPAAQRLAVALDLTVSRELLVMAARSEDLVPGAGTAPEGYRVMNLLEARELFPDIDAQWLRINNEAFWWHPEQGGWDAERLGRAQQTPWFEPEGVLFLITADPENPEVAGFHWTKKHGDLAKGADGEVYVVGLADSFRGKKLGGPLVAAGLQHLVHEGAQRIILYVEADNKPALEAYNRLGFSTFERHVVFSAAGQA